MRHPRRPHPLHTLLTLTILLTLCTAAQADDTETEDGPREIRARDILLSERADFTPSKAPLRSHFQFHKKHGVEYRQSLQLGERKLHLKAVGPFWKKRPGLRLELRGVRVADHDLTLSVYGNTKQQGLKIGVAF